MTRHDFIVVGSGIAGFKAVMQLRKLNPNAQIALITAESVSPYYKPALSKKFIESELDENKIFLTSPGILNKQNIECYFHTVINAIDAENKRLTSADGAVFRFKKLLICSGGNPFIPPEFEKIKNKILLLRTLTDGKKISQRVKEGSRLGIIGGGFIATELAAALGHQVEIHIFERGPRLVGALNCEEISRRIQDYLLHIGVSLHLNRELSMVEYESGRFFLKHESDLVFDNLLLATGIRPNLDFVPQKICRREEGIEVNEYMQTSVPSIFAAGDVALIPWNNQVAGRYEHWGVAEYTGLLAAFNMSGQKMAYNMIPYAWSEIGELRIDTGGNLTDADELICREENNENHELIVFYLKNNRLQGYCCLNSGSKNIGQLQKIIRKNFDLGDVRSLLKDQNTPLNEIVQSL